MLFLCKKIIGSLDPIWNTSKQIFLHTAYNFIPRGNRFAVAFYQTECATTPGGMI